MLFRLVSSQHDDGAAIGCGSLVHNERLHNMHILVSNPVNSACRSRLDPGLGRPCSGRVDQSAAEVTQYRKANLLPSYLASGGHGAKAHHGCGVLLIVETMRRSSTSVVSIRVLTVKDEARLLTCNACQSWQLLADC